MSKDIVPELLEKIEKEFKNKTAKSKIIKKKIIALKKNKVTHEDSNDFAIEVGKILSEAFSEEIKGDILPDNRMYYNIAKRLIEPNLKRNFDIVGDYIRDVQEVLNKNSNISLKAIKPEVNQEKIDGIIGKISDYESFEEGKWLLKEPIINFTQSIVDDLIKANADFQHRAGLSPKIVRKEAGGCCDWCRKLVGTYKYPEDVPDDVWKRHRFCRCTVNYLPGEGKKQDVWSKKWSDVDKDNKIEKRIELSERKRYKKFHEGKQINQYFNEESKILWNKEYRQTREAFMKYTQSGYKNINAALRDRQSFMKGDVHFSIKEQTFQNIKHMEKFIDKQELKENIVVYRSIDRSVVEKQLGTLKQSKGRIYSEKAFSSTSPLQASVKGFYGKNKSICIEYHIPKGRGRGAYINSVSEFKDVEYEYILNTDTKAKIIELKKENDMDIIVMEVLDNEIE